jgi:hypothetical protein
VRVSRAEKSTWRVSALARNFVKRLGSSG